MARGDPTYVFAFGPALNFHLLSQPTLFEVGKGKILKASKDTAWGRLLLYNLLKGSVLRPIREFAIDVSLPILLFGYLSLHREVGIYPSTGKEGQDVKGTTDVCA